MSIINFDDGYSDPDIMAAKYRVGKSAYFEVQLTLAEMDERNSNSGSGGKFGNPIFIDSFIDHERDGTCPRADQWVWIGPPLKAVRAKSLLKMVGTASLFNPITGNYNLLVAARLIADQPLYQITTFNGAQVIVSRSHKVIRLPGDAQGIALKDYLVGGEVVRSEGDKIFSDYLVERSDAGIGDVIEISLASEFIYSTGIDKNGGILAHNIKNN